MKYILNKEFIVRLIVVILVILGFIFQKFEFYFILSSGFLLGVYYGLYNDAIWRPTGKLYDSFPYRAHQLWIHIICGTVGSMAFYFLLGNIDIYNQAETLKKLGASDFFLFLIALLGYVGLLPRILWFFSYAQHSLFSSK